MSTPQQDPKRREPGYYWVKDTSWTICEYRAGRWWLNVHSPVGENNWIEIDECRIEREVDVEKLWEQTDKASYKELAKYTEQLQNRIAELEAQVRELESRLE